MEKRTKSEWQLICFGIAGIAMIIGYAIGALEMVVYLDTINEIDCIAPAPEVTQPVECQPCTPCKMTISGDSVYVFERIAKEIGSEPYTAEHNCVWHSNELLKRLNSEGYRAYEKTVQDGRHMIVRVEVYIEAVDGHVIEPWEFEEYDI
jgi:NADH:ubiquinone oxidoreductase subunit F (NADH-binding)